MIATCYATRSSIAALVCASLAVGGGCGFAASGGRSSLSRPVPSDMNLGRVAQRTAFEDAGQATPAPGPAPADSAPDKAPNKAQNTRTALFWTGIAGAALGGVGTLGFATAGQVTQNKLSDGYDSSLTQEREQELRDSGTTFNAIALASAALAVAGISLAAIIAGIDHGKCGRMITKRRRKQCQRAAL